MEGFSGSPTLLYIETSDLLKDSCPKQSTEGWVAGGGVGGHRFSPAADLSACLCQELELGTLSWHAIPVSKTH